jgi:PIN domain nuclease of toxin-antitoxin system
MCCTSSSCHCTTKILNDRVLIAQSVVEKMPLVTAGEESRKYGINLREAIS